MVWPRMQIQWNGKNYCLSFQEEAEIVIRCFTMYFRHDFLSSCTAIVSGIKDHPSTCISCCSNDLSLLLLCLDLWSLGSENVSFIPWTNFASSWPKWISYKRSKPVLTKYLLSKCQVFESEVRLFSLYAGAHIQWLWCTYSLVCQMWRK